uniref:Uncharacterized protein n=1 Tax=Micrurus spixii TaxID=129469 RepID=A0A2D4LGP7_9SAUR
MTSGRPRPVSGCIPLGDRRKHRGGGESGVATQIFKAGSRCLGGATASKARSVRVSWMLNCGPFLCTGCSQLAAIRLATEATSGLEKGLSTIPHPSSVRHSFPTAMGSKFRHWATFAHSSRQRERQQGR